MVLKGLSWCQLPLSVVKVVVLGVLSMQGLSAQGQGCPEALRGLTKEQAAKFLLSFRGCQSIENQNQPTGRRDMMRRDFGLRANARADNSELLNRRVAMSSPQRSSPHLRGPSPRTVPVLSPVSLHHKSQSTFARSSKIHPSTTRALQLAPEIDEAALRHDIDPLLLHAIAHVESRHNVSAVSPAGALGLMQVMPGTARRFGVKQAPELRNARTNLDVSASYLKVLQRRFGNNLHLVLAAYNAGEGAVERYGRRIPPYAETKKYVRDVLARYDILTTVAARERALGKVRRKAT